MKINLGFFVSFALTMPEEIEERNAASKMWRDEHKELYNARMRAYRKKQKEKNQAQNH